MFKVQENADGSTSVYHKKTGMLMCTIPVKPNSSSPLRINVVEPQPSCNATVVVKDWRLSNFKTKVPDDSSTEESSDNDDLKSSTSSPRASSPVLSGASEAPDDPKEAFVRALNLLPGDLGGRPRGQWPLRRVSRVGPGWPRLITDLTPLSCQLGSQLLQEDPKQNLMEKEPRLLAAVRKYEGLCVAAGLPPSEPSACHARLRCRDRKVTYPICTTHKTMRAENTHVYSYGRRQRKERLRVIETGLDKRSRRLLTQCRKCEVRLERVSKEEIKRWRRRMAPRSFLVQTPVNPRRPPLRSLSVRLSDVTRHIVPRDRHYFLAGTHIRVLNYGEFLAARPKPPLKPKNDEPIPLIDLTLDSPPKQSTLRGLQNNSCRADRPTPLQNSRQRPPQLQNCTSRQRPNSVSLRGPPQLHVSHSVSRQRPSQLHVVNSISRQGPPQLQNSTSRQRPTNLHVGNSVSRQRPPQLQVNHCVSRQRQQPHVGNSLLRQRPQPHVGNSVSRQRPPPQVGDSVSLPRTGNSRPEPLPMEPHGPVLRAMLQERQLPTHFRCFACGCNRFISNNAELEVLEHMRRFHSVMEPDRFLTVYRDQVKQCTIVEAFPGYKGNND